MKTLTCLVAVLLSLAPCLHGASGLRPVTIQLTVKAVAEDKEIAAPTVVVNETKEARVRIGTSEQTVVDVAVTPTLAADQVTIALRTFVKEKNGAEQATAWPAVITKLGTPAEIRCGDLGFRIMATLGSPNPTH